MYTGYKPGMSRGVTEHSDMECRGNFLLLQAAFLLLNPINASYLLCSNEDLLSDVTSSSLLAAIGAATTMF
jgi:hypothetical protein